MIELAGDMGLGSNARCCSGTPEQLTDETVTWRNETTAVSGTASLSASACTIFGVSLQCNLRWVAFVPLVVGNNKIVVNIADSGGETGQAVLNVRKDLASYSVSGKVTSVAGMPLFTSLASVNMNWIGAVESPVTIDDDGTFG